MTDANDSESPRTAKRKVFGNAGLALGAVVVFILLTGLLGDGTLKEGTLAPELKVPLIDGAGVFDLEAHRGKVVLLDFWSTTCPPCLSQIPVIMKVSRSLGTDDLEVMGVEVGGATMERLKGFAKSRGVNYPMGPDLRFVAATVYKVDSLPTLYIVGRDGKIAESHVGFWNEGSLRDALAEELER